MKDIERFWEKVEKTNSCWNWTASKFKNGYGQFRLGGTMVLAHRFSYELSIEKITKGLEIDHLCRNRKCVNPEHLELVNHHMNLLRGNTIARFNAEKTHCPQGHAYTKENIYVESNGSRHCRTCRKPVLLEQK